MCKIIYFKQNGEIEKQEDLVEDNLSHINGMLTRCTLIDGTIEVGYADPFKTHNIDEYTKYICDYIYLWTWNNIDEETNQLIGEEDKYRQTFKRIDIKMIKEVEVILYSNPRWGGKLTNKFEL